jgi:hypothetical protein
MNEKENALREVIKLLKIMTKFGNVLVPNLPDQKQTFAIDRLRHFVGYLANEHDMTVEQIESEILLLSK